MRQRTVQRRVNNRSSLGLCSQPAARSAAIGSRSIEHVTLTLLVVLGLAVFFDYVNGFHDTANAIATSVATRALRPAYAIAMATAFNFIGAFAGTAVAKTIGAGLVNDASTTQAIVAAALIGAIVWNLLTWWLGLPSSSSHALIGGLLGATIVGAGFDQLNLTGIRDKVIVPLVTSPIIGFTLALVLMVALYWMFRKATRRPLTRGFRRVQIVSAGWMAFAHGSNDAQKTMGIITLALVASGVLPNANTIPWEVIVISATAISLGTAVGGWRIMHTMGHRVVDLEPIHGFAAETTGASVDLRRRPAGHAGLDHPRDLELDHGRRVEQGHARGPLGRRPQHPHRLGAHDPRGDARRRRSRGIVLNALGIK